MANVNNEID